MKARMEENLDYTEIKRLHELLEDDGLEHEFIRLFDGWQVLIFSDSELHMISCVQHFGSYGHEQNLIEMAGYKVDEGDQGFLSADECYRHIRYHFYGG